MTLCNSNDETKLGQWPWQSFKTKKYERSQIILILIDLIQLKLT